MYCVYQCHLHRHAYTQFSKDFFRTSPNTIAKNKTISVLRSLQPHHLYYQKWFAVHVGPVFSRSYSIFNEWLRKSMYIFLFKSSLKLFGMVPVLKELNFMLFKTYRFDPLQVAAEVLLSWLVKVSCLCAFVPN